MRKPWITKRKKPNGPGYYYFVTYYDAGKQKSKSLPNKALAEHYKQILYHRLNTDVFISAIDIPLQDAADEYYSTYKTRRLSSAAVWEAKNTISRFIESCPGVTTKRLSQAHIDAYAADRGENIASYTLRKDLKNLRAFVAFLRERSYLAQTTKLNFPKIKVQSTPVKILTTRQIQTLFKNAPTFTWRIRLLISLTTGLRASDVDRLPRAAVNIETCTIDTYSQKTGKTYLGRPLPEAAMPVIKKYLDTLPEDQQQLFSDCNVRKTWEELRVDKITRQQLRKTFNTLVMQTDGLAAATTLLEHSDSRTTTAYYTDQEYILRHRINQLPVKEWLTAWPKK